jgi:hypothetical protein
VKRKMPKSVINELRRHQTVGQARDKLVVQTAARSGDGVGVDNILQDDESECVVVREPLVTVFEGILSEWVRLKKARRSKGGVLCSHSSELVEKVLDNPMRSGSGQH